jgi:hypothetical protein
MRVVREGSWSPFSFEDLGKYYTLHLDHGESTSAK